MNADLSRTGVWFHYLMVERKIFHNNGLPLGKARNLDYETTSILQITAAIRSA